MNDLRYKLNQQAIDPTCIDGQDRDLLGEIELLKRTLIEVADQGGKMLKQSVEENASLREEIANWKKQFRLDDAAIKKAGEEIAGLEAEVERLKECNDNLLENLKMADEDSEKYRSRAESLEERLKKKIVELSKDPFTKALEHNSKMLDLDEV